MSENNDQKTAPDKNSHKLRTKVFSKTLRNQILLIGLLYMGDQIFGFFEQNYLNTYLDQVLHLESLYITLMVSLSAVAGLIMNFVWGTLSDNTRSRWGRRRPYLLMGLGAGITMILFSFTIDLAGGDFFGAYILCLIFDVVIIGITSNAYYAADRALVPDTVDLPRRGRANAIIDIIGYIGLLVAVAVFLVSNQIYGQEIGGETVIGQSGHIFALTIGGGTIAVTAIVGFAFIREVPNDQLPPKKSFMTEMHAIFNWTELRKNKEFFKIILAMTVFRTGIAIIMPFLFIWIFALGMRTSELLIAVLVGFLILMIITTVLGKLADKFGRRKYIPLAIVISSVGLFFAPFIKIGTNYNFGLILIILPFILVAILGLLTPMNAWSQDYLPVENRGKFYGILNIVFTVSQIIGSTIGGIVATFAIVPGFIPESFIFVVAPIFFLGSIPLFLKVKETLPTAISA